MKLKLFTYSFCCLFSFFIIHGTNANKKNDSQQYFEQINEVDSLKEIVPFMGKYRRYNKRLIGRWEIYAIQIPNALPENERKKYIQFNIGGLLSGGRIGKEPTKQGTWTLDKKSKTLTLNSLGKNVDDGLYLIKKLTKKEMILIKDSIYVYLEKVN